MRPFRKLVVAPVALAALVLLVSSSLVAAAGTPAADPPPPRSLQPALPSSVPACPGAANPGSARCTSHVRTDVPPAKGIQPSAPKGYGPVDLQLAYGLGSGGAGGTVAIIDAYDNPRAESDLGVYRSQYGLPACTTANGCFKKVDQTGGASYPRGNSGWGLEIALDADMVSATCPGCKILLVEAKSNRFSDLVAAVSYAASVPGVVAISNSYGGTEWSGETAYSSGAFNHPGIAITASSGDNGYGVSFPASAAYVTAVGGTSLTKTSSTRGWAETAWSGAGSGCSAYIPKPTWQTDAGCTMRTVADVSAVADPNTGVAVYDSYGYGGWLVVGGTSAASPIVASVYALAGNTGTLSGASYPYSHTSSLNDVTSGSNGSCGGSYLCTAGTGYDGPTGLGTPKGTGGF